MNEKYYTDSLTREVQVESLEILKYFHDFCDYHDLKYILDYGTLLGAVRHKGFIPWDDDIDVAMPREDYEKFKVLYKNTEHPFFHQSHDTDENYFFPYPKLRKKSKKYTEQAFSHLNIVNGPWIDIFVYDPIDMNLEISRDNFHKFSESIKHLPFIVPVIYDLSSQNQNFLKTVIKKIVIKTFQLAHKLPYRSYILKLLDKKFENTESIVKNARSDSETKLLFTFSFNVDKSKNIYEFILRKDNFDKRIKTSFENYSFYIPEDYDSVLKNRYGDYMKLPPKEERKSHHILVKS